MNRHDISMRKYICNLYRGMDIDVFLNYLSIFIVMSILISYLFNMNDTKFYFFVFLAIFLFISGYALFKNCMPNCLGCSGCKRYNRNRIDYDSQDDRGSLDDRDNIDYYTENFEYSRGKRTTENYNKINSPLKERIDIKNMNKDDYLSKFKSDMSAEQSDNYTNYYGLTNDQLQYSRNQKLLNDSGRVLSSKLDIHGQPIKHVPNANYKTKIPPIIPPRMLDLDVWANSELTTLSMVNNERNQDLYQSGYISKHEVPETQKYQSVYAKQRGNQRSVAKVSPIENIIEGFESGKEASVKNSGEANPLSSDPSKFQSIGVDRGVFYNVPQRTEIFSRKENIQMNKDLDITAGDMIDSFGYNKDNIKLNLPNNYSFGQCENDKKYNKNLFTQYVDPDVYTNSQVVQPISSTIGISYDQQIPPTSIGQNPDGTIMFQEYDPRLFSTNKYSNTYKLDKQEPSLSTIFDPRDAGYGDNERRYYDPLSSTTKYYYDDVDAYRRPNFITRNNLDHLPGSISYGPMESSEDTYANNMNVNQVAIKAYSDNILAHRNELQDRLMRKRNAELWETRKFPKHTRGSK